MNKKNIQKLAKIQNLSKSEKKKFFWINFWPQKCPFAQKSPRVFLAYIGEKVKIGNNFWKIDSSDPKELTHPIKRLIRQETTEMKFRELISSEKQELLYVYPSGIV